MASSDICEKKLLANYFSFSVERAVFRIYKYPKPKAIAIFKIMDKSEASNPNAPPVSQLAPCNEGTSKDSMGRPLTEKPIIGP